MNVSVIIKYVQHTGIMRAFCLPGGGLVKFASVPRAFCLPGGGLVKFVSAWGTEKIAGL